MTGRRSITDEARKRQAERAATVGDDADSASPGDDAPEDDAAERRKFTQRMPEELVAEVDEFAETHGMSRNAAINLLAKTGLGEF